MWSRMTSSAYNIAIALTNLLQLCLSAHDPHKTGHTNTFTSSCMGGSVHEKPPLPGGALTVNRCWGRGNIFLSGVATGKLLLSQKMTSCPCTGTELWLNPASHIRKEDVRVGGGCGKGHQRERERDEKGMGCVWRWLKFIMWTYEAV